jgi:hypothetical protein
MGDPPLALRGLPHSDDLTGTVTGVLSAWRLSLAS